MELAKIRDGPEVRLVPRRQHPERDVLLQPLLNAPRTEHPHAIAVNQQLRHQPRIVGRLTTTFVSIMRVDLGEIQLIDHIAYEVNQVVFRKPVAQARRQQQVLIGQVGSVALRHETLFPDSV